jgi:hypothetical protein
MFSLSILIGTLFWVKLYESLNTDFAISPQGIARLPELVELLPERTVTPSTARRKFGLMSAFV